MVAIKPVWVLVGATGGLEEGLGFGLSAEVATVAVWAVRVVTQ